MNRLARPRSPLPHTEHGLLRQGMADLPGEHRNLAAMVGIVRNQVANESGDIGTEILDAAVGGQRVADHRAQRRAAFLKRGQSPRRSDG